MDTLKYFVKDGVYKFNNSEDDFVFVCMPAMDSIMGKLVQYRNNGNIYEKTGVNFFLNCYIEGDIKSLFLNRENYEIIGMIGQNFVLSKDEQQLLKG